MLSFSSLLATTFIYHTPTTYKVACKDESLRFVPRERHKGLASSQGRTGREGQSSWLYWLGLFQVTKSQTQIAITINNRKKFYASGTTKFRDFNNVIRTLSLHLTALCWLHSQPYSSLWTILPLIESKCSDVFSINLTSYFIVNERWMKLSNHSLVCCNVKFTDKSIKI